MTALSLFRNISIVLLTIVMTHLVSLNASVVMIVATLVIGILWIAGYRDAFARIGTLCYIAYFAILVWLTLKGIQIGYQILSVLCFLAAVDYDALFQRTKGAKKGMSDIADALKDNTDFLWSHSIRFAIVLSAGLILLAITRSVQMRVHYVFILIVALLVVVSSSTVVYYLRQKNR